MAGKPDDKNAQARSSRLLFAGSLCALAVLAGAASGPLRRQASEPGAWRHELSTDFVVAGLFAAVVLALIVALFLLARQRSRAARLLHETLELLSVSPPMVRPPLPTSHLTDEEDRGELATMPLKTRNSVAEALMARIPGSYAHVRPDGGSAMTYADIAERKEAVDEVKASMAFANSLVNASPDCIQLLDLDGNISFISDLGQELFEIEDFEAVRGKPFSSLFAEEHHGRVELSLRRVRAGQTDRFTKMCLTLGGIAKWWDFIITPVHDADSGKPAGLFVVARDISARQAHAQELSRAKEAAERASLAKTQFLASMSHEIRTPLNAILGFATLARDNSERDPELRRQMELIQKAGESLLTIINDVLDLSKIEAGKIELEERPLTLRGLVEDCLSLIGGLAQQKGIVLGCTVSPAIPARIIADEARLRQVLLNLLNNAVKFTPSGSVRLSVAPAEDGRSMTVSVSDTGIGISPDRISHLFEDFVQGDGSISRQFGGTGLGLSISRQLIVLMGGEIGVSSVVGQGSTFHFTLALIEAEPETDSATAPGRDAPSPVSPRSILLVDDLGINLEIVGAMLRAAGHSVTCADSGPDAIAAYREGRHDLILMDVQMPDMDGLETTRRIRDLDGSAKTIPIIALTANVFSQQIATYRDAGMNDHLGKPFQREALLAMIERWTGGVGLGTAAPYPDLAEPVPPLLNPACQAELSGLIGPEETRKLLLRFRNELPEQFSLPSPSALRADAHAIGSTSGLLGFARLSAAARALEQAIADGHDISPPLTALIAARSATLVCVDALLAAAGPDESDRAG